MANLRRFIALIVVPAVMAAALVGGESRSSAALQSSFASVVRSIQPKIVKLYGAGGLRGLEPYQSGFLISAQGHVLTVWSYVLDSDPIVVTLDDGSRYEAKLLGADPRIELAVLKIEGENLPHFELASAAKADVGTRVLAFSNLFGVASGNEASSVLHGSVAARAQLDARRGAFETPYRGSIYVLDAVTNNPGAAGGALVDQQGRLLGMLGKELRSAATGAWLNYAVPIDQLATTVDEIVAGRFSPRAGDQKTKVENPIELAQLGIVLVPDVLDRTPPYVDAVRARTPAQAAGVKADDLIVFVGEHLVQSTRALREELGHIERGTDLRLVLMRGQELVEVTVKSPADARKE